MLVGHHLRRSYGPRVVTVEIVANTGDVNLRTLAGSPSGATDVLCIIAPGIIVNAPALGAAFTTGSGWTAGSRLYLTNQGYIEGFGGSAPNNAGGDAITLSYPLTIDNASGFIGGGGGGGAPGASAGDPLPAINGAGGGGAGGGQGNPGGAATNGASNYAVPGGNGTAGSRASPGFGGAGGDNGVYGNFGADGGNGGEWGSAGDPGGAGGYAVRRNGHAVTWIAGNDSTRVKGAVA